MSVCFMCIQILHELQTGLGVSPKSPELLKVSVVLHAALVPHLPHRLATNCRLHRLGAWVYIGGAVPVA